MESAIRINGHHWTLPKTKIELRKKRNEGMSLTHLYQPNEFTSNKKLDSNSIKEKRKIIKSIKIFLEVPKVKTLLNTCVSR